MPYVPEAAQTRTRFLVLRSARDVICAKDGCGHEQAVEQLRAMLADGKVSPLRWDDRNPASGEPPPLGDRHWLTVEIDPYTCQVLDDFAWRAWDAQWGHDAPREWTEKWLHAPPEPPVAYRTLLLDKASFEAMCEAAWPSEKAKPRGKRGRSTKKPEILAAYQALKRDGKIDFEKPMTALYPEIRRRISGKEEVSPNLGDEAIRGVISKLFSADKIASEPASKSPRTSKPASKRPRRL